MQWRGAALCQTRFKCGLVLPRTVYGEVITNGRGKLGHDELSMIDWFQIVDPEYGQL